jgi:hypothetical protein
MAWLRQNTAPGTGIAPRLGRKRAFTLDNRDVFVATVLHAFRLGINLLGK